MLTPAQFEAMLRRYAAGCCTAAEQRLVDQWLAQPPPAAPALAEQELAQVRAAMWQRIEQATRED